MKTKLLLHICCAPCSANVVINELSDEYELTGFFYNPNIYPSDEYEKRLNSVIKLSEITDIDIFYGDYDTEKWDNYVKGLESEPERGKRCEKCIEFRLNKAAEFAKKKGIEIFTSTLSVSPHKDIDTINNSGNIAAKKYDLKFLEKNFKKNDGFKKTMQLARENEFYIQNYCGCRYSIRNN